MKVKDIFEAFLPRDGAIDERDADHEVRIVVHAPGSIGGTPSVALSERGIQVGFDWDHGKLLLTPEVPLTRLTPEDVAAIHESVKKGQSWHAYQAHRQMLEKHKVEVAALKAKLEDLEQQAAALKGHLRQVSNELIEEVDAKYQGLLDYPHNQSKYELDMDSPRKALSYLSDLEE